MHEEQLNELLAEFLHLTGCYLGMSLYGDDVLYLPDGKKIHIDHMIIKHPSDYIQECIDIYQDWATDEW